MLGGHVTTVFSRSSRSSHPGGDAQPILLNTRPGSFPGSGKMSLPTEIQIPGPGSKTLCSLDCKLCTCAIELRCAKNVFVASSDASMPLTYSAASAPVRLRSYPGVPPHFINLNHPSTSRKSAWKRDVHRCSKTEVTARHMSGMTAPSTTHHRHRDADAAP